MRYLLAFSLFLLLGQSMQAQQITPQKISGRWVLRKMAFSDRVVDLDHTDRTSGIDYKKVAAVFDNVFFNFKPNGTWTARIPKELTGRNVVDGGTYSIGPDRSQLTLKGLDEDGNTLTVVLMLSKDGSLVLYTGGEHPGTMIFKKLK